MVSKKSGQKIVDASKNKYFQSRKSEVKKSNLQRVKKLIFVKSGLRKTLWKTFFLSLTFCVSLECVVRECVNLLFSVQDFLAQN